MGISTSLFFIGVGKVVFGILIGAAGIFIASRALAWLMRRRGSDEALLHGNTAVAILEASGLIALGILAQHAVSATFSAMDLMYRGQVLAPAMMVRFVLYGLAHVAVSLGVGAVALAVGTWIFGRLTRGVDEMAEVGRGNVGPSLVLGAVMIVMALMTAPGLQTMLDGLLPLPALGRDQLLAPS